MTEIAVIENQQSTELALRAEHGNIRNTSTNERRYNPNEIFSSLFHTLRDIQYSMWL